MAHHRQKTDRGASAGGGARPRVGPRSRCSWRCSPAGRADATTALGHRCRRFLFLRWQAGASGPRHIRMRGGTRRWDRPAGTRREPASASCCRAAHAGEGAAVRPADAAGVSTGRRSQTGTRGIARQARRVVCIAYLLPAGDERGGREVCGRRERVWPTRAANPGASTCVAAEDRRARYVRERPT